MVLQATTTQEVYDLEVNSKTTAGHKIKLALKAFKLRTLNFSRTKKISLVESMILNKNVASLKLSMNSLKIEIGIKVLPIVVKVVQEIDK